jgi:hypothetical protein
MNLASRLQDVSFELLGACAGHGGGRVTAGLLADISVGA